MHRPSNTVSTTVGDVENPRAHAATAIGLVVASSYFSDARFANASAAR